MNKTEVVAKIAEKTGIAAEACANVMDALEDISGNVLVARMKGTKLDESDTVAEIARKAAVPQEDCKTILAAFEQTFGEALSDKFRLFKK